MRSSVLALALIFCGAAVFAQRAPDSVQSSETQSSKNDRLFSSDLVAWTFMQQPQTPEHKPSQQPTPEPAPETQPATNPTPSQPGPGQLAPESQTQPPAAQTFTGTVNKESGGFVLRVSASTSYKLDNQEQVQQFEGQRVRVTGTLERSINLIHVDRIEPMS